MCERDGKGARLKIGAHTAIGKVLMYKAVLTKRHLSKFHTTIRNITGSKYETKS